MCVRQLYEAIHPGTFGTLVRLVETARPATPVGQSVLSLLSDSPSCHSHQTVRPIIPVRQLIPSRMSDN